MTRIYLPRIADRVLAQRLEASGAVLYRRGQMMWKDPHSNGGIQKSAFHAGSRQAGVLFKGGGRQTVPFLMILTGTELAYRREDGVFVVPIGCLKD